MFGYACDETPELMPMTIILAHKLTRRLSEVRKSGKLPYLRPDGKSQVTIEYKDGKPFKLHTIVISCQHSPDVDHATCARTMIEKVILPMLPKGFSIKTIIRILYKPHGQVCDRRAQWATRAHGPQDHRGYLRRRGPTAADAFRARTRRRSTGLGFIHGALRRKEHRSGRDPARLKCSLPMPSACPSRSPFTWTISAPARSTMTNWSRSSGRTST